MSKDFWKRIIFLIILLPIFLLAIEFFQHLNNPKLKIKKIQIGSETITAEIADTAFAQKRGLMYRENLEENQGMLFPFEKADYHAIWMKNMQFSLDILWIKDERVVYLREFVTLDNGEKIYTPPMKVDQVLEIPAGWMEKHNYGLGVEVSEK